MSVEEILNEFKVLTIKMISKVKNDEEFDGVLEERGVLIEKLKQVNPNKEYVKKMIEDLEILKLDKELESAINAAKVDVKRQMADINKAKMAQKQYMNFQSGPHIFSTEI